MNMPVGPTFEIIMFLDFVHRLMFLEKNMETGCLHIQVKLWQPPLCWVP
jgi:hypothetical protein